MKIKHNLNLSTNDPSRISVKLLLRYRKQRMTRELKKKIFEDEVEKNVDFQRHISETALKLNISEEIVHTVVTHYFFTNLLKLKYCKERIRIVIYQFFYIEQVNPLENEYSIFYKDKLKIFKNAKSKFHRATRTNDNPNGSTRE